MTECWTVHIKQHLQLADPDGLAGISCNHQWRQHYLSVSKILPDFVCRIPDVAGYLKVLPDIRRNRISGTSLLIGTVF